MNKNNVNTIYKQNLKMLQRDFRMEYDLVLTQKQLIELLVDKCRRNPELTKQLIM